MANRLSDVDWFMWNGIKSTTYGIHVLDQPTFTSPKERYSSITIPGRSGSFIVTEGNDIYENITISVKCIVDDIFWQTHDYDIYGYYSGQGFSTKDILRTYLNGNGKLTFPHMHQDNSEGIPIRRDYYKARVSNQIDFNQVVAGNPHRTFQINFDCEPYAYLGWGDVGQDLVENGGIVDFANEGNVPSKPLIRIVSAGEPITLTAYDRPNGNVTGVMTIAERPDWYAMWIDCDAKVAYDESTPVQLMTGFVSGDWLQLSTGTAPLHQTGTSHSTIVYPRYRRI